MKLIGHIFITGKVLILLFYPASEVHNKTKWIVDERNKNCEGKKIPKSLDTFIHFAYGYALP